MHSEIVSFTLLLSKLELCIIYLFFVASTYNKLLNINKTHLSGKKYPYIGGNVSGAKLAFDDRGHDCVVAGGGEEESGAPESIGPIVDVG